MKVYIITKVPFPNGMAASRRILCYAKALIGEEVDCQVLIYTRTEVYESSPHNIAGKGVYEGVPFHYIGGTPLRGSNVIIRRFNDYQDMYKLKSFLRGNLNPDDIVFSYNANYDAFLDSIIELTHKKKAYYVSELCELPYGAGIETPKTIRKREKTLKIGFPKYDGVIAISETLKNLAVKHLAHSGKVIKIPILIDFPQNDIRDMSSKADYPYIFHSGTLSEQKDGFLGMLEAFSIVKKKLKSGGKVQLASNLKFISTGKPNGTRHEAEIKEIIEKNELRESVIFTGFLSEEKLKDRLAKATLVIINKNDTKQNKYCFPTKLAEYLAAEKPLIITDIGEATNWLTDKGNAYIVPRENPDALADCVIHILENPAESRKIALNGKALCANSFDFRNYGKDLVTFFMSLCVCEQQK